MTSMTSITSITIDHINTAIIQVDQIPINYEGINYYMLKNNYNLDNIEIITIDYQYRKTIYSTHCIIYNNNYLICCQFSDSRLINNIEVKGIYIITNKLIKLTLMYMTCDATFTNKNCCKYFQDSEEITLNDFKLIDDNDDI